MLWQAVLAASVLGAALGGLWMVLKGKKASEQELPFGSFLGATALLAGWFA
jgi:prepilin signal peptidase PulO-like enzyme (type II secretory pathway)